MPAMYEYTCMNDRCPFYAEKKERFQFRAVQKHPDAPTGAHWHCPHCNHGTDTFLKARAIARVGYGQMTRLREPFARLSTSRILPLPKKDY